jgi:hypothetical protein
MFVSAWMSSRAAPQPHNGRGKRTLERTSTVETAPPLWGPRAAAAKVANKAIARGRRGSDREEGRSPTRKTRPAARPPRRGSRAAAGLHSTPSVPSPVMCLVCDGPQPALPTGGRGRRQGRRPSPAGRKGRRPSRASRKGRRPSPTGRKGRRAAGAVCKAALLSWLTGRVRRRLSAVPRPRRQAGR